MNEHKSVPNIRFNGFEDEWRRITISEVGSVATGNTPSTKQARYYSKKGVPWITPSNIEKNGKVYNVKYLSNEGEKIGRIVPKGSVLVTSIASIGKNTLLKEDSAFNQQINAITPNKKYNSYFLYTACNQVSKKMKDIASAGTMQIVNKKEFSRMLIICPLLLEQEKIGNFFAKLDKLLDLQQQKIDKLELLKKTLLQMLFPKYDKNIPDVRFRGFYDKWEKITFSEIGTVTTGNTPSTKQTRYYSKMGTPWITPSNIDKNGKLYNLKYLSKEGAKIGRIVPAGSVLVTSIASIGKNALLKKDSAFNQQINAITPKKKYDSYFLYSACNLVSKEMKNTASAGTMQIVNKKEFSRMVIKCPLLSEQQKIGNLLSKIDQLIELENKKLQNFQQVKKCLLQNMFVE